MAAHPAIKDKGHLHHSKAPPHRLHQRLERFVIGPVATQQFHVQGNALRIGQHRQQNLGPIGAMIPAMPKLADVPRSLAFKKDTAQIVEQQPHALGE